MQIASRILKLTTATEVVDVAVRIYLPAQESERAWSCRYEIDWPHGRWEHAAWGVDSVQALHLALQMIGSHLYASEHHRSGQLSFEGSGRGYGFPVAKSLRDDLIGDDAKYL